MLERIASIVSRYFNAPVHSIHPNTNFKNDLNADSIDMVEFSIEVEKEFNLVFNDEDIEKMHVVEDVKHYILQHDTALAA